MKTALYDPFKIRTSHMQDKVRVHFVLHCYNALMCNVEVFRS